MKQFNLAEYLANPSRKVITRDGRKVRIICTDFNNPDFPVVAEIKGHKWPLSVMTNGESIKGRQLYSDLFFAPEKHEGWINIYADINDNSYPGNHIFKSKEEALEEAEDCGKKWRGYITTIKIEWEK